MTKRLALVASLTALAAAILALIDWFSPWHALALWLAVMACYFVAQPIKHTEDDWPVDQPLSRPGNRNDVSTLGYLSYTREGLVTDRVVRRLRDIAVRRLRAHGVIWNGRPELDGFGTGPADAAEHRRRAEQLLGAQVLSGLAAARDVTPKTLQTYLAALDTLAPTVRNLP